MDRYTRSRYIEEMAMYRETFPPSWFSQIVKLQRTDLTKGTKEWTDFRKNIRLTRYGSKPPTGVQDIKNINILREYNAGLTGSEFEPLPLYVCTY